MRRGTRTFNRLGVIATMVGLLGVVPAVAAAPPSVALGSGCAPIAVVTNSDVFARSVATIDTTTRSTTGTDITVGASPYSVAITPDGSTAVVTNYDANSVSFVDLATRTTIGTATTGFSLPTGVAITADGSTAVVANYGNGTVVAVDVATRTIIGSPITVGTEPIGVAISNDGTAWVTNGASNSISVIDLSSQTVVAIVVGVGSIPWSIILSPDGATAWVANYASGSISVIDTTTFVVDPVISTGGVPIGLGSTPDGSQVWVTDYNGGRVFVIDTATQIVVSTIQLGPTTNPRNIAFTPDGATAWVTLFGTDQVASIDTSTLQRTGADLSGFTNPNGIAIAPCASLSAQVAADGRTITASGSQFPPASGIEIALDGTVIGSAVAGPDGTFSLTSTIDCAIGAGEHELTATSQGGLVASTTVSLTACTAPTTTAARSDPVAPTFTG